MARTMGVGVQGDHGRCDPGAYRRCQRDSHPCPALQREPARTYPRTSPRRTSRAVIGDTRSEAGWGFAKGYATVPSRP